MRRRRKRRWAWSFFGLTDKYKVQLHELIFDLCHIGKLGYDAVYSMPIQYRTFYIRKLTNMKEKERAQYEGAQSGNDAAPKIARGPAINRG